MKSAVALFIVSYLALSILWIAVDVFLVNPSQPLKFGRSGTVIIGTYVAAAASLFAGVGFMAGALCCRPFLRTWSTSRLRLMSVGAGLLMVGMVNLGVFVPVADGLGRLVPDQTWAADVWIPGVAIAVMCWLFSVLIVLTMIAFTRLVQQWRAA